MNNHPSKQPGYAWASPYLIVSDVAKAQAFYKKAFQLETGEPIVGDDGVPNHAELRYHDSTMMIGKEGNYGSTIKTPKSSGIESPIILYLYCDNVDEFYKHAVAAGAKSLLEPADMFWGDRMCALQDPDGYTWNFATFITAKIATR